VKLGDKYGFVSIKTGKPLTPVKYDNALQWSQNMEITARNYKKKDLAPVQIGNKWGCINVHGEEIIPVKYEKIDINQFNDPRITAKLNGKWGFVNEKGKEITDFEYDDVETFSNSRARVKKDGKYGFIDNKGAIVIPLAYDDCEACFSYKYHNDEKRILPVWIKRGEKYGFMDISGNEIIKPEYELVHPFDFIADDKILAAVVLNGVAGFIDQTGNTVIPFMYDPDLDNKYNYRFYSGFANVKQQGKWGVIDIKNNVIIPFRYDEFLDNNHAGFRYVLRDGQKFSVDTKGNEWKMIKNPDARTFNDYLNAVDLAEAWKSFRTIFWTKEETVEHDLKIFEINFLNFKSKKLRPSKNIIRIHADNGDCDWECPPVGIEFFDVTDDCSYAFFDWDEIPDMEVRIEDNLTLSDADIVAACMWVACDDWISTDENIKSFLNRLHEQDRTMKENK
jgi:hypothetical protein